MQKYLKQNSVKKHLIILYTKLYSVKKLTDKIISLKVNSSRDTYEVIFPDRSSGYSRRDNYYVPKNEKTYSIGKNRRVISSVIHKNEPVFIWGLLKDNQIQLYRNNSEVENILIITDNAERTLQDRIMDILAYQFASALIFLLSIVIIYRFQKDKRVKSYIVPFINKTE